VVEAAALVVSAVAEAAAVVLVAVGKK